jgi:hypothetical protein
MTHNSGSSARTSTQRASLAPTPGQAPLASETQHVHTGQAPGHSELRSHQNTRTQGKLPHLDTASSARLDTASSARIRNTTGHASRTSTQRALLAPIDTASSARIRNTTRAQQGKLCSHPDTRAPPTAETHQAKLRSHLNTASFARTNNRASSART